MTTIGKISNNYLLDNAGVDNAKPFIYSKDKELKNFVEPVEINQKKSNLDDFLKFVSDSLTPKSAYAASSTIDIPELYEVEYQETLYKNEGVSVFYFYHSEAYSKTDGHDLTIAGDYSMREIMNKFGSSAKYFRVDMANFSDEAKMDVIKFMGKNKFPCYLISNKKGTHVNNFKIKGAENKGTPGAVELKKTIDEAYKFLHKDD